MVKDSILGDAEHVLTDLGLPASFMLEIYSGKDDWSFIIKLHALIESVTTYLLTAHFEEDSLRDVFANLELSNKKSGKLAFAKALELLSDDARRFVSCLSEVRNSLVHGIQNITFKLNATHTGDLKKRVEGLLRAIEPFWKPELEFSGKKVKRASFISENRRLTIWIGAIRIIEEAYPVKQRIDDPNARLAYALLKAQKKVSNQVLKPKDEPRTRRS